MSVGASIRKIREEKGLTQAQLGEKCGIAESTIRQYEHGKLYPKIETREKIAFALNVPVTRLMSKPTNNADRVRQMTDDEMVELWSRVVFPKELLANCDVCERAEICDFVLECCPETFRKWLKAPAEDVG